jgi:hypothetical protein
MLSNSYGGDTKDQQNARRRSSTDERSPLIHILRTPGSES